ncbi:MAG: hypothetical protein MUF49_32385, partial [Oculatellaceae cyanobacterium Prado106]|nr:hypothetical protein [Oculatellaceae cyanobacterium Prado106]
MTRKKKPTNPRGRGTANRNDSQRLDYLLPAPWVYDTFDPEQGGNASIDVTGLSAIPLDVQNNGRPRQDNADDRDGFAYDVLIWQIDTPNVGFAQEVYAFQEDPPPGASVLDGPSRKRVDVALQVNSPLQSAVVLIADSTYAPVQTGTEVGDLLIGTQDSNGIDGKGGDDVILGLEDSDSLAGGSGNDQINGGSNADILVGGSGNDQLYGEQGRDTLNGLDGADVLSGGTEGDRLYGGLDNDILEGGSGNDFL